MDIVIQFSSKRTIAIQVAFKVRFNIVIASCVGALPRNARQSLHREQFHSHLIHPT